MVKQVSFQIKSIDLFLLVSCLLWVKREGYPGLKACNFIKKRLQRRRIPVKFANFFKQHLRWLLLDILEHANRWL